MLQLLLRRAKTGNPRAVIYLWRRLRLKWLPCSLCVPCCQDGRKVEPINRTCQGRPVSTQDLVLFRGVGSESSYINQVVRSKPLCHIYWKQTLWSNITLGGLIMEWDLTSYISWLRESGWVWLVCTGLTTFILDNFGPDWHNDMTA